MRRRTPRPSAVRPPDTAAGRPRAHRLAPAARVRASGWAIVLIAGAGWLARAAAQEPFEPWDDPAPAHPRDGGPSGGALHEQRPTLPINLQEPDYAALAAGLPSLLAIGAAGLAVLLAALALLWRWGAPPPVLPAWWGLPELLGVALVFLAGAMMLGGLLGAGRAGHDAAALQAVQGVWTLAVAGGALWWLGARTAPLVGTPAGAPPAAGARTPRPATLGWRRMPARTVWAAAAAGAGLMVAANFLVMPLSTLLLHAVGVPYETHAAFEALRAGDGAARGAAVLAIVVLIPAGEELFFRGMVIPALERGMSPRAALWVSAAIFAAAHLGVAYSVLPILPVGLVLGWLFQRTRSLAAPLIAHGVFNALNLWLAFSDVRFY